jgi:hypothetical protein
VTLISAKSVSVGLELPPQAFNFTRADLVRYAGASGDFNVIHWNERVAKEVGLPSVTDLQKWFTTEIAEFLQTKGKAMIGWDEILGAELPADNIVMVWRGDGIDAIKMSLARKHQMVLTPNLYYYFDWKQTSDVAEHGSFGVTTLSRTYSYEPLAAIAKEIDKDLILGVQGNIWTERITYPDQVSYMAFPRALAIAETGWSKNKADPAEFLARAKAQAKEDKRAQRQSVTTFINESNDLKGVKITNADKKLLPSYMTEKIELENGQSMTKMHNDLYTALNDPEKSVLLAKMLQSGFDFKSIKENAVTKETKTLKNKLRRNKTDTPSSTTGVGSRKLSLAERLTQ